MYLFRMAVSKPLQTVQVALGNPAAWLAQLLCARLRRSRLGLFARTFLLLLVLMLASLGAWLLVFVSIELGPRATQLSRRIATSVNLTQAALTYTPAPERPAMLRELSRREGLDVYARSNTDIVESLPDENYWQRIALLVRATLGAETRLAWTVNAIPGIWVSFRIDHEPYWLSFDRHEIGLTSGLEWLSWGAAALLLSILGAALGVSYINRPLARLARSAHLLSRGESPAPLPETGARELRALNASFNRMARELEQTDTDRALMLAGISHDLRTPLTRMRLEIELSNIDDEARFGIDQDLAQIDHSIGQLMEYARPPSATPQRAIDLSALMLELTERERGLTRAHGGQLQTKLEPDLWVYITAFDVQRVMSNLLENARRYGRHADGTLDLHIVLKLVASSVVIEVHDRGAGIAGVDIERVRRPFSRGDTARTGAAGTGLGLAIVERLIHHAGGSLALLPRLAGGLRVRVELPAAQPES